MDNEKQKRWACWLTSMQAIIQNGLAYTENPFDIERYQSMKKTVADMLADLGNLPQEKMSELFAKNQGYATPKLEVRGAAFKDNKILLVKERSDGLWTLPGGWADVNESPSEAVEKEIHEESGYIAKAVKLVALYDKRKHDHPYWIPHAYKAFFLCEILEGGFQENIETIEIDFFDKDSLPPLSPDRVNKMQILRMYEYLKNPNMATDFD